MIGEQDPTKRYEAPSGEELMQRYLALGIIASKAFGSYIDALSPDEQSQYFYVLLDVNGHSADLTLNGRIDDMLNRAEKAEELCQSLRIGESNKSNIFEPVTTTVVDTDSTPEQVWAA